MNFNAKGLPTGTIVANDRQAWIKMEMDLGLGNNWRCTNRAEYSDYEITEYVAEQMFADLDGPIRVVRVGTEPLIF